MGCIYLNNGLLFLDSTLKKRHIKITHTKISEISESAYTSKHAINCRNQWILPGCIDAHVHFRTPGFEYKEDWDSGSKAALAGGVTTVIDMPNTQPPTTNLTNLKAKRLIALKNSRVHFGFHFGACEQNLDNLHTIENIASIKVYFGSSTGSLLVNKKEQIQKILTLSKVPISFHAEDETIIQHNLYNRSESDYKNPLIHNIIRNNYVAESALTNILNYTKDYNTPLYICHISTQKEHEIIIKAKKSKKIYCEATPHHLFLTQNLTCTIGQFAKVNPPLRDTPNQTYLLHALKNKQIDTIGTDHAPHHPREKLQDYRHAPAGMPGLETCLPLLLSEVNKGNMSLKDLVSLYSENPAHIFGIQNKAHIRVGYDADLIVINPKKHWTFTLNDIHSKSRWNPFLGRQFTGKVTQVFIHGHCAYKNGQFYPSQAQELQYTHCKS